MSYHQREKMRQATHDEIVKNIASIRFDNDKYDIYTNPGSEKNASVGSSSSPLYPDIVALEEGTGRRTAVAIGEIETSESINEQEAEQWADYSNTGVNFFLYVPSDYVDVTKMILRNAEIKISGLRTYHYDAAGKIVIMNISLD